MVQAGSLLDNDIDMPYDKRHMAALTRSWQSLRFIGTSPVAVREETALSHVMFVVNSWFAMSVMPSHWFTSVKL